MLNPVFTIGHSTHDIEVFLQLLGEHDISAIADVRSSPYSRFTPHFNRETVKLSLQDAGVRYVFLGEELGARSPDPTCYVGGKVQYGRLAQTPQFQDGIKRLIYGVEKGERIAIMCAEQEPLACHRTVLVSRVLNDKGMNIKHIRGDATVETHQEAMQRLMAQFGLDQPMLGFDDDERLAEALDRQEDRIAYVDQELRAGGMF